MYLPNVRFVVRTVKENDLNLNRKYKTNCEKKI